MKITFLATHLKVNGGNRVIVGYADVLSRMGHEVTVVIVSANKITRTVANAIRAKPRWFKNFKGRILRVEMLTDRNLPAADVAVAFAWQTATALHACSEKVGLKCYYILHDERLYHGPRNEVAKTYEFPMTRIVLSTWVQERIKRDYNLDSELLIPPLYDEFLAKEYPHNTTDKIRILLVCHDYDWKGTKEGVEIVQRFKVKYPYIELVLYGSRRKNINFPCDEYHYNPSRFELPRLYAGCDIYLCTSWDEGLGLPSMETMACRCALVTYDTGGSRDFAIDGRTALVAPRRNIEALSQKLEMLIVDKKLRDRIAGNGRDFMRAMPTLNEQTHALESIFLRELKKHA